MVKEDKAKNMAVILSVVVVGLLVVVFGLTYIYKIELKKDSCDLCFELNPHLEVCRSVVFVNLSNLTTLNPNVFYGK